MRNYLIVIYLVLAVLISCKPGKTEPDNNFAKIVFSEMIHDYGDISFNSDGRCEFEFTNTSKIPLVISRVRTSCGCTNPDWPKTPVAPGQKSVISVVYNTKIAGTFRKSVTVYSNTENSPIVLYIKGNVSEANQP